VSEVTVKGRTYRTGRLNAWKQFHIARRLAPLLSGLATAIIDGKMSLEDGKDLTPAQLTAMVGPVSEALSKMAEADADYVIDACLSVAQRKQEGDSWAPVKGRGGAIQFDDMDMGDLVQITVETVAENLGGFFGKSAGDLKPQEQ